MKRLIIIYFVLISLVVYSQNNANIGNKIGNIAPEIIMNDIDGNEIKLSSLRGNLVLVDFWAGWCSPCRRENKNIKKAYDKYRDKNYINGKSFKIYGVSLDKSKYTWNSALMSDELFWNNVSSLKHWNTKAAKDYGVRSIPSNFLLDENGVIIEKNLRGDMLEETLEKYVYTDPIQSILKKHKEILLKIEEAKKIETNSNIIKDLEKLEKTINKSVIKINKLTK